MVLSRSISAADVIEDASELREDADNMTEVIDQVDSE
jgi:hypothetical protein